MSKQKPLDRISRPRVGAKVMDRNQARVELGDISYSSIVRLEEKGKLTPIRLDEDSDRTKVFYAVEQVRALVKHALPPQMSETAFDAALTIIDDQDRTLEEVERLMLATAGKARAYIHSDRSPAAFFQACSADQQKELLKAATPEDRELWGAQAQPT